jgi:HPt (histidine-containing phosphotransfer) domain-containing protein
MCARPPMQSKILMSNIELNRPDDLQHDSISDFFDDFNEAYENCEGILIELEHKPDDHELLNGLFRVVHTIKGNLGYIGLFSLIPLLQSLEDVLDDIRKGHMAYDSALCDVIQRSLDCTKLMVNGKIEQQPDVLSRERMQYICDHLTLLTQVDARVRAVCIQRVLQGFDLQLGFASLEHSDVQAPASAEPVAMAPDASLVWRRLLAHYGISVDDDLQFFIGLVQAMENRTPQWHGRTARQLMLSLEMNKQAGGKVDAAQLAVAVMLHDLGIAFLPLSLLSESGVPDPAQKTLWQRHPEQCASLLANSPRWQDAAAMIWQHQEHVDGSGFPDGLQGDEIVDGARIIRIVDVFEERPRSDDTELARRQVMKAVLDINQRVGTVFDQGWVDAFTQVIRTHHQHFIR